VKVYPVFLRIEGERVLVVGGGAVAAGKLDGLLAAGAHPVVVAPDIVPACRRDGVELVERAFVESDLDGVRFVIAAAPPDINRTVSAAAAARNLFVNAVDDLGSATAYLGGVIRRGDVTVAISTGGAAPALAGLLREALDAALPEELDAWLEVARAYRSNWKRNATPIALRRAHLLDALIAKRGST
jgi:siroheme synthase-like protein